MHRRSLATVAAIALAGAVPALSSTADASLPSTAASVASAKAGPGVPTGPLALKGERAAAFRLPNDMVRVHRLQLPDGTTSTRFQQMVGRAAVLNGQITVVRGPSGEKEAVIGAHYPALAPTNRPSLLPREAVGTAERRHGARGEETADLRIDPRTGRHFYVVDQIRDANRWVTWVDAANGRITKTYSALTEGTGVGVKNDRKQFETILRGGLWRLRATDRNGPAQLGDTRQITVNARGIFRFGGNIMFDLDDVWNRTAFKFHHPDQRPAVDAHYYAGVVDDFYADVFGRNSLDDEGMQLKSVVHFGRRYCNAFWNGEQMTYGDGDGTTCKPLSGALDVVGHELTHGVTEFTSNLIYENESGALDEAFSDMMGNTMEFYAADEGLDPAAEPDWRVAEDISTIYDTPGFRNMGDPREFDHPDHYSEYVPDADGGDVHWNSGIPNHAYYLAVNGGSNAGCGDSASEHTHTAGCDVVVDPMGLDTAAQVFYTAFTGLTEYANMCDARNATVAVAGYLGEADTMRDAWAAVGVLGGCTGGVPPPPPCIGDRAATLPFGSPHPYGNDGRCTWTYDNGSAGFQFRFSLLDTEEDYDYVYVTDADGRVLDEFTGTYDTPVFSSCIPSSEGSVVLVTDPGVTAEGFTVDAVRDC